MGVRFGKRGFISSLGLRGSVYVNSPWLLSADFIQTVWALVVRSASCDVGLVNFIAGVGGSISSKRLKSGWYYSLFRPHH